MLTRLTDLLGKAGGATANRLPGSATVEHAVDLMNFQRLDALLVVERERFAGVFCDHALRTRVIGGKRDPVTTRIRDVMSIDTPTVPPNTTLDQAARMLSSSRLRHLAVVADGVAIGIVSALDILGWTVRAQQHQVDSALRAVKQFAMSNHRPRLTNPGT